jgi:NADPH:quinone reductase-like Zn-dependent oxidoreductase
MRAVCVREPGDPDQMTIAEVPTPAPGPEEVRVQVHATALNAAGGRLVHPGA